MERIRVETKAPWAEKVGYSRAVRVGSHVFVSGTAPVGEDQRIVAPGNAYLQTKRALEIIAQALREAGADMKDVVRTRIFARDPSFWPEIGRAHAEVFHATKPATTMVFVDFIDPEILVEIEADAVTDD